MSFASCNTWFFDTTLPPSSPSEQGEDGFTEFMSVLTQRVLNFRGNRVVRRSLGESCFKSIFNVSDRVFGLIPSKSCSSVNLNVLWVPSVFTISRVHFLLTTSIIPFTGQMQASVTWVIFTFLLDTYYVAIDLIV
jgi:hypothetical protein